MKRVVLSGINIFEGGPLTIYKEFLEAVIESGLYKKYKFVAFVHKKSLFSEYVNYFEMIEIPKSRTNYLFRLYYEYVYFYRYSHINNIYMWISLHDITPNVKAEYQYVYCHNPTPFLKNNCHLYKLGWNTILMFLFYRYIYRINIKKNSAVIVQQQWLKQEFEKMFHIKDILVVRPEKNVGTIAVKQKKRAAPFLFLVVSYPRAFKNFEIVCEACKKVGNTGKYQVFFTISGNENKYAKYLYKKYHKLGQITWLGLLDKNAIYEWYSKADCLIFPSKLETWGLPVSEFAVSKKPMLLVSLPYAYETAGNYQKVNFFNPDNAEELAALMKDSMEGKLHYEGNSLRNTKEYIHGWPELLKLLLKDIDP